MRYSTVIFIVGFIAVSFFTLSSLELFLFNVFFNQLKVKIIITIIPIISGIKLCENLGVKDSLSNINKNEIPSSI